MTISDLISLYDTYRVTDAPYWITQNNLYTFLDSFPEHIASQSVCGTSFEGRPIRMLTIGSGKTSALIWSQMHGDEPTATRALLDIFSMLKNYGNEKELKDLLGSLTLYIVPMLNPDGAERFSRRTVMGIDMNRDSIALRTPEARLLQSIQDEYKPAWAFNLHDQEPRYTVGTTGKATGIALLAPAIDNESTINELRLEAMKLASFMGGVCQEMLYGHVARYEDTFEARAFGEGMHRWGSRTVLVEAGYLPGDPTKEKIRKAIAVSLLASLQALAAGKLPGTTMYESLPVNRKYFCEYIIERASIRVNGTEAGKQDVGFYLIPYPDSISHQVGFKIGLAELGDCSLHASTYRMAGEELEIEFPSIPDVDLPADCVIVSTKRDTSRIMINNGYASQEMRSLFE